MEHADVDDAEARRDARVRPALSRVRQIRNIEKTLAANDRPVAVGIPGYIVPMDLEAKLFLTPGKRKVSRGIGRAGRRADGDGRRRAAKSGQSAVRRPRQDNGAVRG